MGHESGAERRAQKAERRADNIRKAYPGDPAAERRARKAERRAQNIRDYADERNSRRPSFWSSRGENEVAWPDDLPVDSLDWEERRFWEDDIPHDAVAIVWAGDIPIDDTLSDDDKNDVVSPPTTKAEPPAQNLQRYKAPSRDMVNTPAKKETLPAQNLQRYKAPARDVMNTPAKKATPSAQNLQRYQGTPKVDSRSDASSESEGSVLAGCAVLVAFIAGIAWVINALIDWFRGLF